MGLMGTLDKMKWQIMSTEKYLQHKVKYSTTDSMRSQKYHNLADLAYKQAECLLTLAKDDISKHADSELKTLLLHSLEEEHSRLKGYLTKYS